jgi:hypothetical protein
MAGLIEKVKKLSHVIARSRKATWQSLSCFMAGHSSAGSERNVIPLRADSIENFLIQMVSILFGLY